MKAIKLFGQDEIRCEGVAETKLHPGWSIIEVGWTSIWMIGVKEHRGPLCAWTRTS